MRENSSAADSTRRTRPSRSPAGMPTRSSSAAILPVSTAMALHVDDGQGRRRFPASFSEVRYRHWLAAPGDGPHAQIDDRAERRRVIDRHVERKTFTQTLDQAVVLDEVHSAVACAFRLSGNLL